MPRLITLKTFRGNTRQWWQRADRETLYRTRGDAMHGRYGVPLHRELNRAGYW